MKPFFFALVILVANNAFGGSLTEQCIFEKSKTILQKENQSRGLYSRHQMDHTVLIVIDYCVNVMAFPQREGLTKKEFEQIFDRTFEQALIEVLFVEA